MNSLGSKNKTGATQILPTLNFVYESETLNRNYNTKLETNMHIQTEYVDLTFHHDKKDMVTYTPLMHLQITH